ncbi:MAG: SDR family NAD(P)-dependent oxidoreductase [Rickettsiales bacterium]|nr:SDR family NAD(P)-dependent oxidoreductase [Rickettsiales bacterium]
MHSKTCLIAGIGPGVGLSVAKAFAQKGYTIAMMARGVSALEGYKHEIETLDQNAHYVPTDLMDFSSVTQAYNTFVSTIGTPDVIVYNAGRWIEKAPTEWSSAEFMAELSLCVGAAHHLVTLSHEGMKKRGSGCYLFTGGGLALFPQYGKDVVALTAGKSALRGYTVSLDAYLSTGLIRASTITIAGQVAPQTAFDPDRIAAAFVSASEQSISQWKSEIVFDGK